jgi:hypothetical protein
MLGGVGLTHELWVEPINTTKYLVNRSPSSVLVDSTPHEVSFGKNPSLSHVKLFGCDIFVHFPKEKRNKMENKACKCIFICDKDEMKGYKLWNHVLIKIVHSQDMVFREVDGTSKSEDVKIDKETEKLVFELRNEEDDLNK